MFNLKKLFLFCIAAISLNLHSNVIVWDLGGVLLETDKLKAASHIGIWDLLFYNNRSALKTRLFDVLNTFGIQTNPQYIAYSEADILPDIMCKWMLGEMHGPQVISTTINKINQLDQQNFFASKREKNIIKNSIKFMFDPVKLAKATKPNKKTLRVLKQCARQKDALGNPCHQLYIISNWDKLSFDLFFNSKQGRTVFKYFNPNNIVVSARVGMIKPHKSIFEYFLSKYNLNANDCIFIDDQAENIKTAQSLGFTGIVHTDAKSLNRKLNELNVLSNLKLA